MILSWVAEGAKLQGIKIAHFATGQMAELLRLFKQNITSDSTHARRLEPIYTKLSRLHGRSSYMDLYCEWLGVNEVVRPTLADIPSHVTAWASQHQSSVLLFPQCTRPIRTWPQNYWLVLQSMLRERGIHSRIVVWDDRHRWRHYSPDALVDLSWMETVALMKQAKAVIGNNSGCVHVAGTLDIPAFVISGLTTRESLGGLPSMRHVSVSESECPCVGCCYQPPRSSLCEIGCLALQSLTPKMVMERIDESGVLTVS